MKFLIQFLSIINLLNIIMSIRIAPLPQLINMKDVVNQVKKQYMMKNAVDNQLGKTLIDVEPDVYTQVEQNLSFRNRDKQKYEEEQKKIINDLKDSQMTNRKEVSEKSSFYGNDYYYGQIPIYDKIYSLQPGMIKVPVEIGDLWEETPSETNYQKLLNKFKEIYEKIEEPIYYGGGKLENYAKLEKIKEKIEKMGFQLNKSEEQIKQDLKNIIDSNKLSSQILSISPQNQNNINYSQNEIQSQKINNESQKQVVQTPQNIQQINQKNESSLKQEITQPKQEVAQPKQQITKQNQEIAQPKQEITKQPQ